MNFTEPQSIAPGTESGSSKKRKLHPEASDSETNNPFRRSPPMPMNLAESTNLLGEPDTQADAKTPPATMTLTDPGKKSASDASDSQPNTSQVCSPSTPLDPAESTGHHHHASESEHSTKIPSVKSFHDLLVIKTYDDSKTHMHDTAYHATPDDVMYFCKIEKEYPTFSDFYKALEPVPDEELYPLVPADIPLTIAPENLDESSVFIKRHGFMHYEDAKGTDVLSKTLLSEVRIFEQLSQSPHPHIVHYYGCRIKRGRITAILLEKLENNLPQYVSTPEFQHLDKKKFMEALESAIDHLHSLGLAHNDLNPNNIMVRNGLPVLVDFGSAGLFGEPLHSSCTTEWYPELVITSQKKHDIECLAKLREWIEHPKGFVLADSNLADWLNS